MPTRVTQQYSYAVGAFQIGYAIMHPVCGRVIDLIGLRIGFALPIRSRENPIRALIGNRLAVTLIFRSCRKEKIIRLTK
jgi:MFS family permease